jgi:hypothetical protein
MAKLLDGTKIYGNVTIDSTATANTVNANSIYITTTSPGTNYIDTTYSNASYNNSATVNFPNFSGMIIVNNTGATGVVSMWLCGGGSATPVANSGVSGGTGTVAYNSGITGYIWTNNTGGTITASFAAIRTRIIG